MKTRRVILVLILLLVLSACGISVPPEKQAYVGEWKGNNIYLYLSQDGTVEYWRTRNNQTTSINAQLQGFEGNNFDVGIGPVKTAFFVSKPPYQENGQWKMVVDGAELVKTVQ